MDDEQRARDAIDELIDIFGPHVASEAFIDFLRDTFEEAVFPEMGIPITEQLQ